MFDRDIHFRWATYTRKHLERNQARSSLGGHDSRQSLHRVERMWCAAPSRHCDTATVRGVAASVRD
jgi:hypothetical protein